MNIDKNTSLLLTSQLPEYIRSDPNYSNFGLFLQSYYEWMEQSSSANNTNVLYNSKNILNYADIDQTTTKFLEFFVNDFLQYFPKNTLISKRLALKAAKELYTTKGTPSSYQFLFRILYNSDCELFNTDDAVFKASAGVWYITKSLKLLSDKIGFLNIQNKRIVGETSRSIATVENSTFSGTKTEVFISNIERLFKIGEYVRVVDNYNQDVYYSIDGKEVPKGTIGATILRAKIVGQINQINIDPKNRGELYNPGDPIVVYGGFDGTTVQNPIGATAKVSTVTSGSIKSISVINGGFGYTTNSKISITNAPGAIASISNYSDTLPPQYIIVSAGLGYMLDDVVVKGNINSPSRVEIGNVIKVDISGRIQEISYRPGLEPSVIFGITANVVSSNVSASGANIQISSVLGDGLTPATYIVTDSIFTKKDKQIGNSSNIFAYSFARMANANTNTKMSDAFTFQTIQTRAISAVSVDNGGLNIQTVPTITATSLYEQDNYVNGTSTLTYGDLSTLGILSPIQIFQRGLNYVVNDMIVFTGGSGYGAYANVTSVDSSGGIVSVDYFNGSKVYPLGGMGYRIGELPTLTITSSGGSGALLVVPGILGSGAELSPSLDRVGEITKIDILTFGEDYASTPNVSLAVQDIVVTNVTTKPKSGDIIYQGSTFGSATYVATVHSIDNLDYNYNPLLVKYNLRVYDFNAPEPNKDFQFKIYGSEIPFDMAGFAFTDSTYFPNLPAYNSIGVKSYGNGKAKATATFLNGLVVSQGEYLTSQGQPSSFSVLQSENFNNFTYQITVEKEISKYRNILLNLLHPTGAKMIGRYAVKSSDSVTLSASSYVSVGKHL